MISLNLFTIVLVLLFSYQNEAKSVKFSGPPDPNKAAEMARYIVHESNWVSIATISSLPEATGYPFANIISMADGPVINSTGVPYMYTTLLELSAKDLEKDTRCTLTCTLAEESYCADHNYDPEDPRCAHVMLIGRIAKLEKNTEEYTFATRALFERHPIMKDWPKDHQFFAMKLILEQVYVQDYFGGPKHVPLPEYFAVNLSNVQRQNVDDSFTQNQIYKVEQIF